MSGGEREIGATIVPSPLGGCAVAFGAEGLLGVVLPGANDEETLTALRTSVRTRRPDLPPAWAPEAATGRNAEDLLVLARHLRSGDADLATIRLDYRGLSPFRTRVSELARTIPRGEVRTYGEIARAAESVARAVGRAMATNPFAVVVPCHRVVAAGGGSGGFSAPGGLRTKDALLRLEGGRLQPAGAARETGQATLWHSGQK